MVIAAYNDYFGLGGLAILVSSMEAGLDLTRVTGQVLHGLLLVALGLGGSSLHNSTVSSGGSGG